MVCRHHTCPHRPLFLLASITVFQFRLLLLFPSQLWLCAEGATVPLFQLVEMTGLEANR